MSTADAANLSHAFHRQQTGIAAEVMQGVSQVWRHVDPRDVERSWPVVSAALGQIVAAGHSKATVAGAAYMAAHAQANGITPTLERAAALPAEQIETALRVTGPVAVKVAAAAGMLPEQAGRTALVQVMGSASRLSLLGARETVKRSAEATGGYRSWMRVAHGGCSYCEAHSGVVFTVGDAEGDDFFAFHDHCGCTIEPVLETAQAGGPDVAAVDTAAADTAAAVVDAFSADALGKLADGELAKLLVSTDVEAQFDAVVAELDRRDEVARAVQKAEAAKAAAKVRRDAKRAADLAAKDAEFDRMVAAGADAEQAYADVYGVSIEKQRAQAAIGQLRAEGYRGVNFERLSAAAFKDEVERLFFVAEDATRGWMLNDAGKRAGVNARDLFTGSEARALKYASQELRDFWHEHGRLTLSDYRATLLGGKLAERTGGESWSR